MSLINITEKRKKGVIMQSNNNGEQRKGAKGKAIPVTGHGGP
jgi:hypothetical protein